MTKKNDWTLTFSHSKLKITYRRLQIAVNCFQITDCSLHIADYRLYVAYCSLHMHLDLDLNVKPNLELNLKLNLELNVKLCKQCRGGATPFWWPRRMTWHLPFLIVNWKLHTIYCKLLFTVSRFQIAVYILQITQ